MVEDLTQTEQEIKPPKLALVTALNDNGTALVTFFGEDDQSQKGYSYLSSYKPAINDTVLMVPFGKTYIITGRVKLVTEIPEDPVMAAELETILADYATKDDISGFLTTDDLTNYLQNDGTAHGLTLGTLTVTGTTTSHSLIVSSSFWHSGSAIGFFGGSTHTKTPVGTLSSTATNTDIINKINELRNALNSYNLV